MVVSKEERKAIFLDLTPLFAKVQSMYFGSLDNFQKTRIPGQKPAEWPYQFEVALDFAPVVVKSVDFSAPVTAVRTSLKAGGNQANQAYIATEEGTLRLFTVGGYGNNTVATPASIQAVGSVLVGKNPTSIAYQKDNGWDTLSQSGLIVVSRAERKIDWVHIEGTTGTILRTLRDSRMQDPLWVEDNDNHGTQSPIITVTDYHGRQVLNYRYGPVVF